MVETTFVIMCGLICFVLLAGCIMIGGWIIEDKIKEEEKEN